MTISLTGFMGCGKSSVGRRLSELLSCSFVDLDSVIEEREGRTIPEIFASDGETAFRQMEKEALEHILFMPEIRQCAPLAPSQLSLGPSPYAGVRKCQFRTSALSPDSVPKFMLALGGGTVMTPECAEIVQKNTLCIYLRASVDTLVSNLSDESEGRPMLKSDSSLRERIEELMNLRSAVYEKTAHIIVDTDGKSIEAITDEIRHLLTQWQR